MGANVSYLPDLAQNSVLSNLLVEDARNLMITSKEIHLQVVTNRSFWIKQAKVLHDVDPITFHDQSQPLEFPQNELVKKVCEADIEFEAIKAQIRSGNGFASTIHMSVSEEVDCISVDIHTSLLAVAMGNRIDIFSLLAFGDPALRSVGTGINSHLRQIVLHGDFLYCRSPINDSHHTNVHNHVEQSHVLSVAPRYVSSMNYSLR